MSTDTLIAIAVFIFLFSTIWKLNSTKSKSRAGGRVKLQKKNTVNDGQSAFYNNSAEGVGSYDEATLLSTKFEVPDGFLTFKLMNSALLEFSQRKRINEINQCFRKPHPMLLPLIQGVFEPTQLFDLIKTDVEITAKVLNVVNSPLFALRQPITNINHAIIFLGITEVKNIALQFALQNDMSFENALQNKVYNKLWLASSLASAFCLLLAKKMGEEDAAELSTHCLLSYLGDLATLSYDPSVADYYLGEDGIYERTLAFQESFGANTAVIGKQLAHQWQLPKSISDGIERSLLPLSSEIFRAPITGQEMQQVLICYLSCRLGDLVAFHGLSEISQLEKLSFDATGKVEFYHIQECINQNGLTKINTIYSDPVFKNKINRIIQQSIGN